MKGQRYLFNAETPESVIVGTSLSDKMLIDSLNGIYSLSLAGLNVFDGLHIVFKRKNLPKTIFIESNNFFRPENKAFKELFDSQFGNTIKKNLVALRESNQPVGIVKYYISSFIHTKNAKKENRILKNEISVPQDVFSQLLKTKQKQFNEVDTSLIENSLNQLQRDVANITTRGTIVCFFEMPISPELENLPLANYVRTALEDRFRQSNKVLFIKLPDSKDYKTLDGIHLNEYGAWEYTKYFKEEMDRLSLVTTIN